MLIMFIEFVAPVKSALLVSSGKFNGVKVD